MIFYGKFSSGITVTIVLGNSTTFEDTCGQKCDVRSGDCIDSDGNTLPTDTCGDNVPCYPGCNETCEDYPSRDYCGKLL